MRGKSDSGQRRHPAIRWFGPRVALAAFTAASIVARISGGGVAGSKSSDSPAVLIGPPGPRRMASIRPGAVSPFHLGRWIVLAGVGLMALALTRFLLHRREIEGAALQPRLAADVVLLMAVALSGLAVLVFLVVAR